MAKNHTIKIEISLNSGTKSFKAYVWPYAFYISFNANCRNCVKKVCVCLMLFVVFLYLNNCSTMNLEDYKNNNPKLVLENFFLAKL